MFHEPTQSDLKAAAGWTLVKRIGAPAEHVVALDKYRDGCEALLPYSPDGAAEPAVAGREAPSVAVRPAAPIVRLPIPTEFTPRERRAECQTREDHEFDPKTQHCIHCGWSKMRALATHPKRRTYA